MTKDKLNSGLVDILETALYNADLAAVKRKERISLSKKHLVVGLVSVAAFSASVSTVVAMCCIHLAM